MEKIQGNILDSKITHVNGIRYCNTLFENNMEELRLVQ